jgi:RNA polymerase sigma-70 factor, ECF subfamily
MHAGHTRQSVLPGGVHSQAEQDAAPLVKASQQGDQDAFALLVRRHQRRLFNLSLGLLQDEEDASESVQEAFVAAWQKLPGFRGGEAGFPTWLYRIAYRCCLRQLERRTREHARHSSRQVEQALMERRTEEQAAEAPQRHDRQALVREQMEYLPLTYRAVLILRYLHGKTYEEIAAILSIPGGTVKTHLFGARTLLKERLLAQPLVTRETVVGTPPTENENGMHTSGQFHAHGRGQNSSAVNQETEDFSQQQHAWVEQRQNWVEQQHSALEQADQ